MVLFVSATSGYVTPSIPPLFFGICSQPQCDCSVSVETPITSTFFDLNSSNVLIKSPIDLFVFMQNDFEFVFPQNFQKEYNIAVSKYFDFFKSKCLQYKIDYVDVDIRQGFDKILSNFFEKRYNFL